MSGRGGWRVAAWSRELARGRIESDAGVLDFDGACALVADFQLGEAVEVELTGRPGAFRVAKIWPAGFRSPLAAAPVELSAGCRDAIAALGDMLDGVQIQLTLVELRDGTARFELTDRDWPAPHGHVLGAATFAQVSYVQMPVTSTAFAVVRATSWNAIAGTGAGATTR